MDVDKKQVLVAEPTQPSKDNKRLSVERIYQKKTQLEHILLRPDTYIGSVEPVTQTMWVWDEGVGMVNREVTYVPGLYKIFDEIVVNAADNKQRDAKMSSIKINIKRDTNTISIWNDGKGIPVIEHKVEKMYVPEMIFGHLLTSSNYNDEDKKVTGGRNGYGAKLCNIFSLKFTVETSCKEYNKKFKQIVRLVKYDSLEKISRFQWGSTTKHIGMVTGSSNRHLTHEDPLVKSWSNNMSKAHERKIASASSSDYTQITFQPDLEKFRMKELDKDIVALLSRRAYDIAGSCPGVKVYLNGERLPVKNFKDYVSLYVKDLENDDGEKLKVVYDQVNPRWEVCITSSNKGFQQISFVNSIATTKGGRHVDYIADQVNKKLAEVVKKKNKGGVDVKAYQMKNYFWVFVNCLIENPTFDSQTKETMTLVAKKFGSSCSLTDKFLNSVSKCGIVDNILNWVKFKNQSELKKKSAVKSSKLKGIPKLDDANNAGTKNSHRCTLILTEGDSAKTLAISGLSVIGRDDYGVFPLRGKMLNVRDASVNQITSNAEINNIVKIMGLKYQKKYASAEDIKTLRYGKIMIMTDQDHDGSHIKGLLINFIHKQWPEMLRQSVVEEFITPIVKVSKGSQVLSFYTIPEFQEWATSIDNPKSWKVKYYKGLGTSTSKEAKEYFADMLRHRVTFNYSGPDDDGCIDMAFNKNRADDRKDWLNNYMDERRRCREDSRPEPGSDLYTANKRSLSYKEFINKELVMFSFTDLERSIPSLVDGLKPGQRKILYTCFRRNDKREVKVAQLAGSVAELSAYHHGEVSLQATIVNMAQNYVGSNNLNLLQPIGQFGTRLYGGKDSASSRYIFTMLSPLTRLLFPAVDDNLLTFLYDDNQKVEPTWYCPIIPMVLANGTEGIGTGWSTRIPNHDIRALVDNCKRMMVGEDPLPMTPSYKNFRGTIEQLEPNRYAVSGEIAYLEDDSLEITELPIKTWTQPYKESVIEPMLMGTEKVAQCLQECREYNTDTSVKFVIKMSRDKLKDAERKGLHKFFNLQSTISCNNLLVVFDQFGCLRKFSSTTEILHEFYHLRLKLYGDRKDFLIGLLTAEALKLNNQARFIVEKIEGKISIFNKLKKKLIAMLQEKKYDSDPLKAWKESRKKVEIVPEESQEQDEEEGSDDSKGPDYNYILNMPLWSLTKERKDDLLKQKEAKQVELNELKKKTSIDLWRDDLDKFLEELDKVEQKEREDAMTLPVTGKKKGKGKGGSKQMADYLPAPDGVRVEPKIDPSLIPKASGGERKPKIKREKVAKAATVKNEDGIDPNSMDADAPPSLLSRIKSSAEKSKTGAKAAAQKRKGSKMNPWDSGSESDSSIKSFGDDSGADFVPRKRSKRAMSSKKKKYAVDSDSFSSSDEEDDLKTKTKKPVEEEDDTEKLSTDASEPCRDWDQVMGNSTSESDAKKQKSVPVKRKKPPKDDSASDEPRPKVAKKKTKAEGGKRAATKKPTMKMTKVMPNFDDVIIPLSDCESTNKPKSSSKPIKRKPTSIKSYFQAKLTSDSEKDFNQSDDSDVILVRTKPKEKSKEKTGPKSKSGAQKKKKKNVWSDSDEEEEEEDPLSDVPVKRRTTTGRRQKAAKYTFSDDDSDDE